MFHFLKNALNLFPTLSKRWVVFFTSEWAQPVPSAKGHRITKCLDPFAPDGAKCMEGKCEVLPFGKEWIYVVMFHQKNVSICRKCGR